MYARISQLFHHFICRNNPQVMAKPVKEESPQPMPFNGKSECEGEGILLRGKEIIFQGFNWESHREKWWCVLKEKLPKLADVGFTTIWLPPAVDSLASEGYLPKDLYSLYSAYGTESELRILVQALHDKGLRAMADIVINHRIGTIQGAEGLWNRYDDMRLPWDERAVTSDTGGHGNPSTGEVFPAAPNIDHTQEFVRKDLGDWLRWLRQDVGFDDFRFDFAKGYKAEFVKGYIEAAKPVFAVGEYWDTCNYTHCTLNYDQDSHRQRTVDWIDSCGGLAAAFDFTTKAILQEACRNGEWWRLRDAQGKPPGVIGIKPSHAVTFIDNHDTGSTQNHWPFPSEHVLKGYAYTLTHPGQPSVFHDHFFNWGDTMQDGIKKLISIRKEQGIHSCSLIEILDTNAECYGAVIDGSVCVKIGGGHWKPPEDQWRLEAWGEGYAVWLKGSSQSSSLID